MPFVGQLQIDQGRPLRADQALGLRQGKAQHCTAIARFVGKHFLQEPIAELGKGACSALDLNPRLGQGRLALDIGNTIPQRGKALLAVGRRHDNLPVVNKTGTSRLPF